MKTETGHETTLESTLNGYDVHLEDGLNLYGVGVKQIEMHVPKDAYFSMLAEYYKIPKLLPVKVPNLYRLSNPYLFMNNQNEVHDSWEKKRTDTDGTYIYAYTNIIMGSETNNSYTTFQIPPTADKGSYEWARNQGGNNPNPNQNNNTMGFTFKPNTTYTWRFKMRTHYQGYNSQLTTMVGFSAASTALIVDPSKSFIVNGKNYEDCFVGATKRADGAIEWHKVLGQEFMNKRTSQWTICEFQFTTLPVIDNTLKQTYRWRFSRNTSLDISESMIYEGENTLNPPYAMTTQENWEYNYYRGRQGLLRLYPNMGFYYSKEFDFACAYAVNVSKGIEVISFNPNTQEYLVSMEVDVFSQVTNVVVNHYNRAEEVPNNVTVDNTILHSNIPQTERWLYAKGKGGIVDVFNSTNVWRPQTMTANWSRNTFSEYGWGSGGYFYTGNLDVNEVEN